MSDSKYTLTKIRRMSLDEARDTFRMLSKYIGTDEWDYQEILSNILIHIATMDPFGVAEDLKYALKICDSKMSLPDYRDEIDYGFEWEDTFTADFMNSYSLDIDEGRAIEFFESDREYMERVLLRSHHIPGTIITSVYNDIDPDYFFIPYMDMIFSNKTFLYMDSDDDWFNIKMFLDWFGWTQPYNERSVEALRQKVHELPEEMRDSVEKHLDKVLKEAAEMYNGMYAYNMGEESYFDDDYSDEEDFSDEDYDDIDDENEEIDAVFEEDEDEWDDDDDILDQALMTDAITIDRGENPLDPEEHFGTLADPFDFFGND